MSTVTLQIEKKKTHVPQLRFSEFDQEWIKDLFGKYILNSAFGPRFSSNLYSDKGNVATLRTTDMDLEGNICYETMPLANIKNNIIKDHILEPNDIVISRSGTIGITGVFKTFEKQVIPGAFLIRFRVDYEKINSQFIKLHFNSEKGRNKLNSLSAGGVQKNLTGTSVKQLEIILPDYSEQTKIADFLTSVDEKVQQLSRKKELLEQYKKGIMQQLFSGKLRFKDKNGNDYPDWEEKMLGQISKITTGSSNRIDSNLDGEFTFFDRSQDIRSSNRFLFDTEAVIVPGEGQEFIPKYFVGKFDLHQRTYAVMNFKKCVGKFLFYYVGYNSNHLNSHAVGSTVKSLRLPMFEKMPIKLPCLEEQQKNTDFLSSIDAKIENVNQQLIQTENFKKGLLQQMFV